MNFSLRSLLSELCVVTLVSSIAFVPLLYVKDCVPESLDDLQYCLLLFVIIFDTTLLPSS